MNDHMRIRRKPLKPLHYIITIQYEMDLTKHRQMLQWESKTIIPEPGETRKMLFNRILNTVNDPSLETNPVPLFFYLGPEEL
jgi:hypothetical protein